MINLFTGNHYGTPKPSKDSVQKSIEGPPGPNSNLHGGVSNVNFPGAHPSSEGKRRRNRSNVEAMTAKHSQNDSESSSQNQNSETKSSEDLNQGRETLQLLHLIANLLLTSILFCSPFDTKCTTFASGI